MIQKDETRQFLNDLYITDLCVWAQWSSHRKLQKIAERLRQFELKRDDMDLALEELESTVLEAMAEANNCPDDNEGGCQCQSESSEGNSNSNASSSSEDDNSECYTPLS
jgi:hypothetical protein